VPGFLLGLVPGWFDPFEILAVGGALAFTVILFACVPEEGLLTRGGHAGKRWSFGLEAVSAASFVWVATAPHGMPLWVTMVLASMSWISTALLHWRNFEGSLQVSGADTAVALAFIPFGVFLIGMGRNVAAGYGLVAGVASALPGLAVLIFAGCTGLPGMKGRRTWTTLWLVALGAGLTAGGLHAQFTIRQAEYGATAALGAAVLVSAWAFHRNRTHWHQQKAAWLVPLSLLLLTVQGAILPLGLLQGWIAPQWPGEERHEAILHVLTTPASLVMALGLGLAIRSGMQGSRAAAGWLLFALALALRGGALYYWTPWDQAVMAYLSGSFAFVALAWREGGWGVRPFVRAYEWLNGRPAWAVKSTSGVAFRADAPTHAVAGVKSPRSSSVG
jgi:hypothetical protein